MVQIKSRPELKTYITIFISMVWLLNGLFCKLLKLVPRHQQIVERILDLEDGTIITKIIGAMELCMVIWIISRLKSKFCSITQILTVSVMNVIEFLFAPDLLLFGRMNIVFAVLFCMVIYFNEFVLYSEAKKVVNQKNLECSE